MYIVTKEWKGSPDGCTVIDFKPSAEPVTIPESLVEIGLRNGWIRPQQTEVDALEVIDASTQAQAAKVAAALTPKRHRKPKADK